MTLMIGSICSRIFDKEIIQVEKLGMGLEMRPL